jgi:hypothetical protein
MKVWMKVKIIMNVAAVLIERFTGRGIGESSGPNTNDRWLGVAPGRSCNDPKRNKLSTISRAHHDDQLNAGKIGLGREHRKRAQHTNLKKKEALFACKET